MSFLLKKYLKSRKNQLIILILIGLFIFWFFGSWSWMSSSNVVTTPDSIQTQIQSTQQAIAGFESDVKQNNGVPDAKELLAVTKASLPLYQGQKNALLAKNYNEFFDLQYQLDVLTLNAPTQGQPANTNEITGLKSSIAWYQAVKKSGQSFPVVQGIDPKGFGIALDMNADLSGITILVVLSLLVGDFIGSEFPDGLRFYELVKSDRKKLLFQYFLIPVFVAFAAVALIFLIYFLVIGFWQGWGSPLFPSGMSGPYVAMPVWQVAAWAMVYLLVSLIFLTALGQLLTTLFRRQYLPMVALIVLLVAYSQLQTQTFMKGLIKFVPFTYLGSGGVFQFSGGNSVAPWPFGGNYLFGSSSLWVGVFYLLACSILFYLLTTVFFSKYIYRKA